MKRKNENFESEFEPPKKKARTKNDHGNDENLGNNEVIEVFNNSPLSSPKEVVSTSTSYDVVLSKPIMKMDVDIPSTLFNHFPCGILFQHKHNLYSYASMISKHIERMKQEEKEVTYEDEILFERWRIYDGNNNLELDYKKGFHPAKEEKELLGKIENLIQNYKTRCGVMKKKMKKNK